MRKVLAVLAVVLVLVLGGGVAVAAGSPDLRTGGPTAAEGTDATAVFEIADRTIRQVRYADGRTLRYTFELHNDSGWPVTVRAADRQQTARLFDFTGLTSTGGGADVEIPAGGSAPVTIALDMGGCETLASRSGSFFDHVRLTVDQGPFSDEVDVALPEEIHTGSPREAFCPDATATSRPQG